MPLDRMSDEAFADAGHGEGVYIISDERKIVSPFDGTVADLDPVYCTITLISRNDLKLMIKAESEEKDIFKVHVKKDQKINKGDLLITFPENKGSRTANIGIAVTVINSDDYLGVIPVFSKHVDFGDMLITTIVSEVL